MQMTFRWYGTPDPVRLEYIRQIPGVSGIVSALHDLPTGVPWPAVDVARLRDTIAAAGLDLAVVESVPVHEDIKLGRPTRDRLADAWAATLHAIGAAGVPVVCYNFMPVFDWTRTDLSRVLPDGSTTLAYDHDALGQIELAGASLPGWATHYDAQELAALRHAYASIDAGRMWENLAWFLERVVPEAEAAGVKLALHPDDPPWPVLGLPRIITDAAALERVVALVDSPANGVTLCTGSLAADPANDLVSMARALGARRRIGFVHCRNVRVTGPRRFHETAHPGAEGDVDMSGVLAALHDVGYAGPVRPDHGRMIWGEEGRPGYGLHDRALGAMYLQGLWEGLSRRPPGEGDGMQPPGGSVTET